MKIVYDSSFIRDLKKIKNQKVKAEIAQALEAIEKIDKFSDIPNLKKMKGAKNLFRVEVRDFRLTFFYQSQELEFIRCLDRKDIYKKK